MYADEKFLKLSTAKPSGQGLWVYLLTGPFSSQKEANRFIDALVKAGASRPLLWTSPAGEVVDDLSR